MHKTYKHKDIIFSSRCPWAKDMEGIGECTEEKRL